MDDHHLVHVATVSAAHGVHGQLKLFCLLEHPRNLAHFSRFFDEHGEPLILKLISVEAKLPIASLDGVADRNAAERCKDKKIFARASDFPAIEPHQFYSYQLVGMRVMDKSGNELGKVLAHHNFGAGDILEVAFSDGTQEMLPFQHAVFPEVDIAGGRITLVQPTYL